MMGSRFATLEEIGSPSFQVILDDMYRLHREYDLPNHKERNSARYPWSIGMQNEPEVYAARLWEYPFCALAAELGPGMVCADVGCGMSAFTIYMRDKTSQSSIGIDPDLFKQGVKHLGHGVNQDFLNHTGLDVQETTKVLDNDLFDRVFCISVIEHVPRRRVPDLMHEMTRILKPGGLLIMTVDVNIEYDMSRPMDLIWQSGLVPKGSLDLAWPTQRLGRSNNLQSSADVYGLILEKPISTINEDYTPYPDKATLHRKLINQSQIPSIRSNAEKSVHLPLRLHRYLKAEWLGR